MEDSYNVMVQCGTAKHALECMTFDAEKKHDDCLMLFHGGNQNVNESKKPATKKVKKVHDDDDGIPDMKVASSPESVSTSATTASNASSPFRDHFEVLCVVDVCLR